MLSFANLGEIYFLIQIILDILLFLTLLFLVLKFKKLSRLPVEDLSKRLSLAEKLTKDLERYVEEEKKLLEKLRLALETGAKVWENSREGRKGIKEKIWELRRRGLSTEEICKKLSLSEGEVELVLSLERFRRGEK